MNNFWESELGEVSGTGEDAYAKSFKQIPDGSLATARIENYAQDSFDGVKFFQIDWVLTGGEFNGQHVFQKIKAIDADPRDKNPLRTRHRALNMMKLLYNMYDMKPASSGMPDDRELARFHGKIAGIKIQLTDPNHEGKQYNWVSEIHPAMGFKCETGFKSSIPEYKAKLNQGDDAFSRERERQAEQSNDSFDDGIPF